MLIDGRDARERSQLWLHSNIGYVLQTRRTSSPARCSTSATARENDHGGDRSGGGEPSPPEGSLRDCRTAIRATSARGGNSLSRPASKLLSFARALLADPRIFVLDEATSSVDTVTERLIQDAIEKVMDGRTSFVIAHRLSTIRRADVILVVNAGKIVERGSHAELMAKKACTTASTPAVP